MKHCMSVLILSVLAVGTMFGSGNRETGRQQIPSSVERRNEPSGEYPFTLSVYGNADMNDVLDQDDLNFMQGIIGGSEEETPLADANRDGRIDDADLTLLTSLVAGEDARISLVDNGGVTVTLDAPVSSGVSLFFGALRPILFLGSAETLTGIGSKVPMTHQRVPMLELRAYPQVLSLPEIGSTSDPSQEAIVALAPDVIFGSMHTDPDTAKTVSLNTGTPFVYAGPSYFGGFRVENGAFETWRLLSLILGEDARVRAEELIRYSQEKISRIEEITAQIPLEDLPRVYLINGSITDSVQHYEPIDIAGGINVVAETSSMTSWWSGIEASKEQLIAWDPEVILIHCYSRDSSMVTVERVLSDPDLQTLSAVKNQRVYNIKAWYGGWDSATAICDCFYLAKLLHPALFQDLDVEEECNAVLEEFYGVPHLYDWMLEHCGDFYTWK